MQTMVAETEAEAKLEQMVEQYQLRLLRLCYAYLHDRQLAEDAVQETFLKAYRQLSSFRGECAESSWITRIAINTCKNMLRSRWFKYVNRHVTLDTLPDTAEEVPAREMDLTVKIMQLPLKLREAVLLCWYQGMSYTEAAACLGVSQQAVSSRIHRARKKLQELLKEVEEK